MRRTAIVFFVFLAGVVIFNVYNYFNLDGILYTLKESSPIIKIEMRITCSSGVKKIVITDRKLLDTIAISLKTDKEIDVPSGGIYDIWANVEVYKKNRKVSFQIQHSPFYGWSISIGNRSFASDYMFNLIKGYSFS